MVPYQGNTQNQDPFYNGQGGPVTAVDPPPVPMQISTAMVPAFRASDKLRSLLATPSGLPSFDTAMHPDNFPFVEGCRQWKAINYGVVKIGNVCVHIFLLHETLLTMKH